MHPFSPSRFFDLTSFLYPQLFSDSEPVWKALEKLQKFLLSLELGNILGEVDKHAYLVNPESISIGTGSIVEPGAYIKGPCWIGKNCQVRHGAYIRGHVITGDQCVIGHATEVKNSIFLNKAQAGHFAYIGDSILGNQVNLGAGVKCANLRFDKKNILISCEGQVFETDLRKLGAVLGDGVQIGCNAVMNPGTVVGKKSFIGPGVCTSGCIPESLFVNK